jgi:transposase
MKKNTIEEPKQKVEGRKPRRAGGKECTIGIDLGDRSSHYCVLDRDGEVVQRGTVATTRKDLGRVFGKGANRIAIEVGPVSPWVSRHLKFLGYEVIVANARRTRLIAESNRKHDRLDCETLARLARMDPKLLFPVRHRSEAAQADLAVIRTRAVLVEGRTRLINSARGQCKAFGHRLKNCDARYVKADMAQDLPDEMKRSMEPLLEEVEQLSARIQQYDRLIEEMARERYPEVKLLTAVNGVGTLTALTFMLSLDDPQRFGRSREVGAYLGMKPRLRQSSRSNPELGISKEGDVYLRKVLVQSAHVILGHNGVDSDLRRFGQKLAARGGKGAKKKARVAVARKLAVLLHHLWVSGEVYEPLHSRPVPTQAAA